MQITKEEFGSWLTNEIKYRELTIADVARKGGTTVPTIWRIAKGERYAGLNSIIAIAKGLSISPLEVFSIFIGEPLTKESAHKYRLFSILENLDFSKQQQVIDYAIYLESKN